MLKISCLSAACIAALALVSCQKETTPAPAPATEQPSAKTYTLTVDATKGEDTKALSLDGQVLNVKWAATDQVSVFAGDWSGDPMGTLTAAASETGSTTLTGAVTGANKGDNLNFLFPRAEWSYTGQKGILLSDENSIEKKYDYAAATVTVNEVDGTTITTNTANFTSQQAIVKFRLTDGGSPIAVNSLTISANSGKLVTNKSYRGLEPKSYYYGNGYYTVDGGSGGHNDTEVHNKLVDNDLGTKWGQNKPSGGWYIEFHTASAIKVDGYMLRTGGDTGSWDNWKRNPQDWVLKGKKNSGDGWTDIDTKSGYSEMPNTSNTAKDFDVDVPGEYQYFRLEISNNRGNGGAMQLSEMQLFKYDSYEMGTSYGNITVTPDAAASEFTVALRNENASTDTYTLTATVGASTYTFEKSGITFENGKYYSIMVKMQPKKVSSITLNKSSINLTIGSSQTLSVTNVSPDDAVDKSVTWSSSATGVATVNATTGKVTAVAEGTATITATANDGSGTTATCTVKVYPEGTVVWDSSNISDLSVSGTYESYTKEGITLRANADMIDAMWYAYEDGIYFNTHESGGFTFTAPTGKQFTKIEMTLDGPAGWDHASLGTGWSYSEDIMTGICKVTWTGSAASVGLLTGADHFSGESVKSIVFFLE
ncbi:MAG: Ig-like domain-containing protein [Bacteroidales bacterium]|nr:Ig-like domain-containing protein [Bacteroidales bacterium]